MYINYIIMIIFSSLEIYASSISHHFRWIILCHYEGLTFLEGWLDPLWSFPKSSGGIPKKIIHL